MHLISYGPQIPLKSFYPKRSALARPYTLAHLFRKLRHNRTLTKGSLAAKFGVSEEYVSSIEAGTKFPSLNFCLKCAQEFEINPYYVKNKWAKEAIARFSERVRKRLGLLE